MDRTRLSRVSALCASRSAAKPGREGEAPLDAETIREALPLRAAFAAGLGGAPRAELLHETAELDVREQPFELDPQSFHERRRRAAARDGHRDPVPAHDRR